MNKFLQKVAKLFLGLSLAAGVGVAVSENAKNSEKVETKAASAQWELVTSAPSDWSGEYILANGTSGTVKMMDGSSFSSSSCAGVDVTVSSSKITADTTDALTIAKSSTSGKYTVMVNGKYIGKNANSNGIDASDTWSSNLDNDITYSSNKVVIKGNGGRVLTWFANNSNFRYYASSNNNSQLYKKIESKTLSSITTSGQTTTFDDGDTFSYGGTLTAHYSDSSTATVTPKAYKYGASGIDPSSAGTTITTSTTLSNATHNGQYIYISYEENSTTKWASGYQITVNAPKTLSKIELSGSYPTTFYTGDAFSYSGMTVTATYSDSSTANVTTNSSFSGYNMSTAGNQTVTVSYTYSGKTETASYSITLTARALTGISLSGQTTSYTVGDTFSFDGTCTASYSNAVDRTVTPTSVSSPVMSSVGEKTVTVSYTENGTTKDTSYSIFVSKAGGVTGYYTLTPVAGSDSGYASAEDIDITDEDLTIKWNVTGNSSMVPWRIGGKNLDGVDRTVYSKDSFDVAISKIDLDLGAASSVTVNSLKLVVSSNSDFSSPSDQVTVAFTASTVHTFEPTSGTSWAADSYYKFVFNVTIGGSNKFVAFNSATFYTSKKYSATIGGANSVTSGQQWSSTGITDEESDPVIGAAYTFTPSANVSISSPNTSAGSFIATLTSGSTGTVTVTASAGSAYEIDEKEVSVMSNDPYLSPDKLSTTGYTGCSETIAFSYGNLTGALGVDVSNGNVTASIENDDEVSSAEVLITFVSAGNSEVYLMNGNLTAATISVTINESSVTITGLAASADVYTGKTLNLGETITVTAVGSMSDDVTWESDDDSIATVNSSTGVVTGVVEGTVDITVTANDDNTVFMTCSVTVADEPLQYVINFGSTKNTNPTEINTDASFKSTWPSNQISDVTVGDFSKIYGVSSSQLKGGSGSASASISFTIPSDSYITSVIIVVETAGGTSMNVVSGASSAQTENQSITAGTLTFDDYLPTEKSNYVLITSTASGAFYLSSITIRYANFDAELTASPSSFDIAINSSQNVTLTPSHFTPTSYSAVVKSGSSLTANAVTFSGNVAIIATGSSTGITVFTITGTGGGKSASVDVTVDVTEVRNLLTLSITTASDATAFKVGDTFDVGSLAITATFDADPTTVVFSKANGNIGLLDSSPAIGYEFQESDIGVITSVIFELKVGTGDEYVEYSITVSDKTYAAQVTDVQDLWDGQQIYFGNGTDKVNIAHAGGNQLGSQDATIHETKGLCVDDLAHDGAYTVHREKIDSVIYYSFYKDGYYLEASNYSNNYLTRTTTLSDNCRYTISISNGEVTMTNKGNSNRPEFRWNSGSNWFSQYQSTSTLDKAVIYAIVSYSEEAVAESFEENWLHMSDYTSSQGWCADEEHAYYSKLKPVWAAMGEYEKSSISSAGQARLIAWATANGETLDSNMDLVAASRISVLGVAIQNANTVAIIVIISMVSVTAIGGYFFLRKRKENI